MSKNRPAKSDPDKQLKGRTLAKHLAKLDSEAKDAVKEVTDPATQAALSAQGKLLSALAASVGK